MQTSDTHWQIQEADDYHPVLQRDAYLKFYDPRNLRALLDRADRMLAQLDADNSDDPEIRWYWEASREGLQELLNEALWDAERDALKKQPSDTSAGIAV